MAEKMDVMIRPLKENEYGVLADFLVEAIYVPAGTAAPPKSIIDQPELQVYLQNFGKKDDHALAAEKDGKIVGVVWTRIMQDYGHIDDETPSFAIALDQDYRGQGIGTRMMQQMLAHLKQQGYRKASLSVQQANAAVSLYQQVGFKIVDKNEEEYIMVCDLNKIPEVSLGKSQKWKDGPNH